MVAFGSLFRRLSLSYLLITLSSLSGNFVQYRKNIVRIDANTESAFFFLPSNKYSRLFRYVPFADPSFVTDRVRYMVFKLTVE